MLHFVWRVMHTNKLSHVTIFICHIKTSAPVFQQMNLSHKILANVLLYTGKEKLPHRSCHRKFARVDAALGLLLRMFCFLCFTSAVRNKLYYTGDEPIIHSRHFILTKEAGGEGCRKDPYFENDVLFSNDTG